jgi:thiol-disulfide isomerase/thioredoxin
MRAVIIPVMALVLCLPLASAAEELDQSGKAHAWRGEVGQYTVIDFAASWCGPCWRTLPKLASVASERPDLRFLVISVDEEVSGRDYLVERLDLEMPVLWDGDYAITEHYQPSAMPATFVISPDGEVVYSHAGSAEADWKAFETFLAGLDSDG